MYCEHGSNLVLFSDYGNFLKSLGYYPTGIWSITGSLLSCGHIETKHSSSAGCDKCRRYHISDGEKCLGVEIRVAQRASGYWEGRVYKEVFTYPFEIVGNYVCRLEAIF